jgi:hypothetical protein
MKKGAARAMLVRISDTFVPEIRASVARAAMKM